MIAVSQSASIYLYTRPTDMRKSFCGLSGIVRSEFGQDPTNGSWFLFINRRRDRIKILYWDQDGMAVWYKRLEAGSYEVLGSGQTDPAEPAVQLDSTQLAMILGGVPLDVTRRKRFRLSA